MYKIVIINVFILSFFVLDVVFDFWVDDIGVHLWIELIFVLLACWLLYYNIRELQAHKARLREASEALSDFEKDLSVYIENILEGWLLSKAEKEVAMLIIKGFTYKEIASLRSVSEKTIQNQAISIFNKSNNKNRHEFLSHFLLTLVDREDPA